MRAVAARAVAVKAVVGKTVEAKVADRLVKALVKALVKLVARVAVARVGPVRVLARIRMQITQPQAERAVRTARAIAVAGAAKIKTNKASRIGRVAWAAAGLASPAAAERVAAEPAVVRLDRAAAGPVKKVQPQSKRPHRLPCP